MYVLCAFRDFWESGLRQLERFKHYYLQPFAIHLVDYPKTHTEGKKGKRQRNDYLRKNATRT